MDFALTPPTRFAPSAREDFERIREEHAMVAAAQAGAGRSDSAGSAVAVVNESRQIVHADEAFLRFTRAAAPGDLLGLRIGEALGCVHATEDTSGCGTHPSCCICGTVNSTLLALAGHACATGVNMEAEWRGRDARLDFDIVATPFPIRGRLFARVEIRAIEDGRGAPKQA